MADLSGVKIAVFLDQAGCANILLYLRGFIIADKGVF